MLEISSGSAGSNGVGKRVIIDGGQKNKNKE
jgi:hypothetical protein